MVTPLPLIYDEARHSLIGHVSRANPHWHADGAESVAIFSGPHAYISPNFYATKAETGKVVPTWNYEVLNVYGRLVVHDDPDWVLNLVTMLTNRTRQRRTEPWQVTDAPKATHAVAATRDRRRRARHRRKSKARRRCRRTNPNATGRVSSPASRNPTHRTISSSPTGSTLSEAHERERPGIAQPGQPGAPHRIDLRRAAPRPDDGS